MFGGMKNHVIQAIVPVDKSIWLVFVSSKVFPAIIRNLVEKRIDVGAILFCKMHSLNSASPRMDFTYLSLSL